MSATRVFPAFAVGFGIVYLASMYFHPTFTLFTYIPKTGGWATLVPQLTPRQAPGMFWYSWLATGLIGGVVASLIALVTPEKIRAKVWTGWVWVVPVILTVILIYIERTWFGFK